MNRLLTTAVAAALFASSASAISFVKVSDDSTPSLSDQLSLTLVDQGGSIGFMFSNVGSIRSRIGSIQFDDGSGLLDTAAAIITDSGAGVAYQFDRNPPNMGGGAPGFSDDYAIKKSGVASNMVNNTLDGSEWVQITFGYRNGGSFSTIANALGSSIYIGLHMQSFADGSSAKYLSVPDEDPDRSRVSDSGATFALLGLSLGVLGFWRMRKRRAGPAVE